MPWYGQHSRSIRHDDVLSLSSNPKLDLLQGANRSQVVDPWVVAASLSLDFNFANQMPLTQFVDDRQVFLQGVADVIHCLLLVNALRMAAWQPDDGCRETFFGRF
jgi:hypothetical protein